MTKNKAIRISLITLGILVLLGGGKRYLSFQYASNRYSGHTNRLWGRI